MKLAALLLLVALVGFLSYRRGYSDGWHSGQVEGFLLGAERAHTLPRPSRPPPMAGTRIY